MAAVNAARDGQTALAPSLADAAAAGNVVFSPVSVHAALALMAAGARGATLAQLLAFLGAPSAEALAKFSRRVADRVLADRSDSGGPRVLFGGGVWVDAARGGLIADAFRDVAVESYKSEAPFTDEPDEAAKAINEWVKKATDNLIDTIITRADINTEIDLVLANAVYFKGKWLEPFHPCDTEVLPFRCLDGSRVKVKTMWMRKHLHVARMDGFKVLKLPYKPGQKAEVAGAGQCKRRRGHGASAEKDTDMDGDTQYSMFIFLPDKKVGIATMVDVVTAAPSFMYGVLAEMKEALVELRLPKFKVTFNWAKLEGALRQLGLSLPFSPEAADLGGMYKEDESGGKSRRRTFLGKVAHMAVVEVNEAGTEAAATMGFLAGGGGPPPGMVKFYVDRPFTFFIMEEKSGVIVFAGHVLDPSK